nr:PREDICTED: MAGUK p55 subfamily member 2 [Struthio camelus australis]
MPPFRRKTLVLIGAQGVGRRSLKNKLLMSDQARYGTTLPHTSRKPKDSERDGHGYRFVARGEMEADIKAGRYLEHGEYEGNLYGTSIDSIRAVVAAGKMCILDVNPQCLRRLQLGLRPAHTSTSQGNHYVGQMHEGSMLRVTLDQLTDGQLVWQRLGDPYDVVCLGARQYQLRASKAIFAAALEEQFPAEKEAIGEFMRLSKLAVPGDMSVGTRMVALEALGIWMVSMVVTWVMGAVGTWMVDMMGPWWWRWWGHGW